MRTATASNDAPLSGRGAAWKAERRTDLLDAAERAIRRIGPGAAMDDVAAEAGVSRVVLYRYFGDKGGLYRALGERYVASLMDRLRAAMESTDDPEARLEASVDSYVGFIEENREAYDFLVHRVIREGREGDATVAAFMRSVAVEVGEVLTREIARLGFDPDPADAWAHGVVGFVQLASDWWLQTKAVSRERFVFYVVALLSRGFIGLAEAGGLPPLPDRSATGTRA